eukprot:SAG11_NODE_591_length_8314_cov_3.988314_2_plen_2490_part_01
MRPGRAAVGSLLLILAHVCYGAVNRIHHASSAPGTVQRLWFTNITHSSAVLHWEEPPLGDWQWRIEGYKIRQRSFVYAEHAFTFDEDLQSTELGGRVNASGTTCNCDDLCLVELTKAAPCQLRNAETWSILGHTVESYETCHHACCGARRCGVNTGIAGVAGTAGRRSLQEVAAAEDQPCENCGCTTDFDDLPASHFEQDVRGIARVITSNGIPTHSIGAYGNSTGDSLHPICQVHWRFELPATPRRAAAPTALPLSGIIGFALDGVPYFSPRTADGDNAVALGSPCAGQSDANGAWHYFQQPCTGVTVGANDHVGYALDGFKIYGPLPGTFAEVDAQLDECNGRTVDGVYRYHTRTREQVLEHLPHIVEDHDDGSGSGEFFEDKDLSEGGVGNWKYVLGCYTGTPRTARVNTHTMTRAELPARAEPPPAHIWGYAGFLRDIKNRQAARLHDEPHPLTMAAIARAQTDPLDGSEDDEPESLYAQTPHIFGEWELITGVPGTVPGPPEPDRQHMLYGLKPDHLYYFQVQAYNLDSEGPWGAISYALHTHAVPDKPLQVQMVSKATTSFHVKITPPRTRGTNGCSGLDEKDVAAGTCTTWGTGSTVTGYEIVVHFKTDYDLPEFSPLPILRGCTQPSAINYDPDANYDAGNCLQRVSGCLDQEALNYDPTLNISVEDNSLCIARILGCMDGNATNYNSTANTDDGSCFKAIYGCTNPVAQNWDVEANTDDGSCIIENVWIGGRRRAQTEGNGYETPDFVVTVASKLWSHPFYGNGSNLAYMVNGEPAAVLNLTRGKRYVFQLSWEPGTHPFYFSTDPAGRGEGIITEGVENSLATGTGQVIFTPDYSQPDIIYYQCYFHQYMGYRIELFLDDINFPAPVPPPLYPPCLSTCFRNVSVVGNGNETSSWDDADDDDGEASDSIFADPTTLVMPDWYNFAEVCEWLGAIFGGCNTGPRDALNFIGTEGCQHSCTNGCEPDIKALAFAAVQSCPFGCDGDASTGAIQYDVCGVCGGDGSSCEGCTDTVAYNWEEEASVDDGSCLYVHGCMDPKGLNFDPLATAPEECFYPTITSCHPLADPYSQCVNYGLLTSIQAAEVRLDHCLDWVTDFSGVQTCARFDPSRRQIQMIADGCPDHAYGVTLSCKHAMAHRYEFGIPKDPGMPDRHQLPTNVSVDEPVAIAINGVPIFYGDTEFLQVSEDLLVGSWDVDDDDDNGEPNNPYEIDFDMCQGHVDHDLRYQYRQPPLCILAHLEGEVIAPSLWDKPEICFCNSTETDGIYDVHSAVRLNGTALGANISNYTGDGYVDMGSAYASVIFSASSCLEGTHSLAIRYSTSGAAASMALQVNSGAEATVQFPATATPSDWAEMTVSMALETGTNEIHLTSTDSASINIDRLVVVAGCPGCGDDDPKNIRISRNWVRRGEPSSLVGWARDGFAVYGPYDETGNFTYPEALGGTLDRCNGRIGIDGRYRYHLTPLSPHTIGCFRGTPGTFSDLGSTGAECDPTGTGTLYKPGNFVYPECNVECMPACTLKCTSAWAWFRPGARPRTGLLDTWATVPQAPRVYQISAAEATGFTIEDLEPCAEYSVVIRARNMVGKSVSSEAAMNKTFCRPTQPAPVHPLAVTDTSLTVAWSHVDVEPGNEVSHYRLFISQLANETSSQDNLTTRWVQIRPMDVQGSEGAAAQQYILGGNYSELLTHPPHMGWNLPSGMWAEVVVPPYTELARSDVADMKMTLTSLSPATAYRLRITAVNEGGESFASYDSAVVRTLDAPVTQMQIFGGQPCVYPGDNMVPFHAVSDGTNVKYQWRTSWGGRAGFCRSADCSAMEHSFSSSGQFQIILYASNSRGFRGQLVRMNVRGCGCSDPFNSNFWYAALHHIPEQCDGFAWDEVEKVMSNGEIKYFSFPTVERTFAVKLTLRVDVGTVDFLVSTTQLPDWRMPSTYAQAVTNVSTFAIVDLDYGDLYDTLKYDATERLLVAVVARDTFNRFDVHAVRSDFTQGDLGPALRRNLDQEYRNLQISSGYYDFWEYFLPMAAQDGVTDITISLQVYLGCITVYASKYERYPSPLRAHSGSYGHDASLSAQGCSGTNTDRFMLNVTFEPSEPRVLFMSVYGGKVYVLGNRQPDNSYTISPLYFVDDTAEESSSIRAQYSQADETNVQAGTNSTNEIEGLEDDVHHMGWRFYTISCDQFSTAITVQLAVTSGEVTVYKRTADKPMKGKYDLRARDTDGDNLIEFSVPFNEIGSTGSFHLGVFGDGAGLLFEIGTYARTNGYILTVLNEGEDCDGDYVSCNGLIRELEDEEQTHDLLEPGEYRYFNFDLTNVLASDKWDNSTGMSFGLTGTDNLFQWTAPHTAEYISRMFQYRIVNVMFNVSISPVALLDEANPVSCVLFGATTDPFPGHTRTYDVYTEYTFTSVYDAETGERIMKTLELPVFNFNPKLLHFSVTCDRNVPITVSATAKQFDRGNALSEDPEALVRTCPGESQRGDLLHWRAEFDTLP